MFRLLKAAALCLVLVSGCAPVESATAPAPAGQPAPNYSDPLTIETRAGVRDFRVEIANTDAARLRGMMYRNALPEEAGMLFDLEVNRPITFWMKNTYIPLDIVFIGDDGRIRSIIHSAKPRSQRPLRSLVPVRAVLEINGGAADKLGIAPGDLVRHRILGTVSD